VVAGIILAAGESRRMGSPKALLSYRGRTFLDTLIALFREHCREVIVVLGAGHEQIQAAATEPATFVVNEGWASGMTGSLQCGLRAISSPAEGVLFTLVDHPSVRAETLDTLLAGPRPLLRVPRYQDKRGHPIWFRRDLAAEFLALPESGIARDVVYAHRAETEFLDLDDPGIVADIDDAEAYQRLTEAAG
jgi:CTP:molybdopterin cytidylyltransferase MocA